MSVTNHQRKAELYRAVNHEAARIIAADLERYPGLMQEWAAVVLAKAEERTTPATRRAA